MQRYGDVAGLLIIQAADGVFLIKLQRGAILQHLDANAFRHPAAGFFIQQGAHGSGSAGGRVPENEVLMLAYPVSLRPPLHRRSILKSFPAGGGADPFQVGAPDGTHIDIHIFPAQHRTGGRDHGDGVGAQIGFEDRVTAASQSWRCTYPPPGCRCRWLPRF